MKLRRTDLVNAFSIVGTVEEAELKRDHAVLTFASSRAASKAVSQFDGGELGDRTIEVFFQEEADRGGREAPTAKCGGHDSDRGRDSARNHGSSRLPEASRASTACAAQSYGKKRSRSPKACGTRR